MNNSNENIERLPIKVVFTGPDDLVRPDSGGGPAKVFDEDKLTPELRTSFVTQVRDIAEAFSDVLSPSLNLPAVARVTLKEQAIAKSHRPTELFSEDTCPIIGCENFGSLLIRVSRQGLLNLAKKLTKKTRAANAAISTLVSMEPFRFVLSPDFDPQKRSFKLRLFDHGNAGLNHKLELQLLALAKKLHIPAPRKLNYGTRLQVFEVACTAPAQIRELSDFVGTQSLNNFEEFRAEAQTTPVGQVDIDRFPVPDNDLPVVGLIDTGVSPDHPWLQPWIVDRDDEDVPAIDRDHSHGTFIAGLIVNGRDFNHGEAIFPHAKARIVDVVAMPKGGTNEYALLETIRRVVRKYPEVKIWNLSINHTGKTCQNACFSSFAIALDEIQQQHGVTFVNSAGNHPILRTWPPSRPSGEQDRITPPADTALGITVGSIAHLSHASSIVERNEPSPFSRRGPGLHFFPSQRSAIMAVIWIFVEVALNWESYRWIHSAI